MIDYANSVRETDVLPDDDLSPVLMGLYGEVGGIMSTAKKHVRESAAYPGFKKAAEEEFGDTLWYLSALCRRLDISLGSVFQHVGLDRPSTNAQSMDDSLFQLGQAAGKLLGIKKGQEEIKNHLEHFARCYVDALRSSQLNLMGVAHMNVAKVRGAFVTPNISDLPLFDDKFEPDERIPSDFRIRISLRETGKSYLRMNDVFIGDPLTDNIADQDGYRFHDVFHFAYAAILHWSPVFRSLIKQKRKRNPQYDENEDGGRAIVVEEGLTAWIFVRAKELKYFENQNRVSLGILKTIQEFVGGYEVDKCPLKLWERAILDGYSVFRQIRDAKGGWVTGNLNTRTITFEPL